MTAGVIPEGFRQKLPDEEKPERENPLHMASPWPKRAFQSPAITVASLERGRTAMLKDVAPGGKHRSEKLLLAAIPASTISPLYSLYFSPQLQEPSFQPPFDSTFCLSRPLSSDEAPGREKDSRLTKGFRAFYFYFKNTDYFRTI